MMASTDRATLHSQQSCEWYTPRHIIDAARDVMGSIELDPASCEEANAIIRAARYFDATTDGLSQSWTCETLWLNPPYGKRNGESLQAIWSQRLIAQYRHGLVGQACLLVNAMTGNRWFKPLWDYPLCFVDGRIRFVAPAASGPKNQPTHSSVVVYFGGRHAAFERRFADLGRVIL